MLWMDLALHCDRAWKALTRLLSQEHARFNAEATRTVVAVERAAKARATWLQADQLACHIGQILSFMSADPETPLRDLIGNEE